METILVLGQAQDLPPLEGGRLQRDQLRAVTRPAPTGGGLIDADPILGRYMTCTGKSPSITTLRTVGATLVVAQIGTDAWTRIWFCGQAQDLPIKWWLD
jgi:hypothetical protein